MYRDGLQKLDSIQLINAEIEHGQVPTYVEVLVRERDELVKYLHVNRIQSRPFYPNLDTAPYLKSDNSFPNSQKFSINGLFLPSGPGQSIENINKVINTINKFEKSN
jgi:dTDP-4-amino-4,6-dideoxygalactose transaminase